MTAPAWATDAAGPEGAPIGLPVWSFVSMIETSTGGMFVRAPIEPAPSGWTLGTVPSGQTTKPAILAPAWGVILVGYRRRWIETVKDGADGGKDTREWWAWNDPNRRPANGCRVRSHAQLLVIEAADDAPAEPCVITGKGYATDGLWNLLAVPATIANRAAREAGRAVSPWQWAIPATVDVTVKGRQRIIAPRCSVTPSPGDAWVTRSKAAGAFAAGPEARAWAAEWADTPTVGDERPAGGE